MDCVFCKIIAGTIPSHKVFEDANTVAFMDINPVTEGHVLIVPKEHCVNLFDAPDTVLAATMRTAALMARALRKSLSLDSLNMLQASGPWAKQSVQHLHVHLIPRREEDGAPLDWELRPGDMKRIQEIASRVRQAL